MTAQLNPINRKKLPGSKWTAVHPSNRLKHFVVLDWVMDDDGAPTENIEIEAIMTREVRTIRWRELRDPETWRTGWR